MVKKKRTKSSYYGNTPEAIARQRQNLIPGNAWNKRQKKEMRLDCWLETLPLENIQEIYEQVENNRFLKETPKEELKDEEYLLDWWQEKDVEDKENIYKYMMKNYFLLEDREAILKIVYECLEEKIKKEEDQREKNREYRLAMKRQ